MKTRGKKLTVAGAADRRYAEEFRIDTETARHRRETGDPHRMEWDRKEWEKRRANRDESDNGDDLNAMLQRVQQTELSAARMLREAEEAGNVAEVAALARHHAAAAEAVLSILKRKRELDREAGDLVTWDQAATIIRDLTAPIRAALETLPRSMAARCNPTDPACAEASLEEWVGHLRSLLDRADNA